MCFFSKPEMPDIPAPPPLPKASPQAFDTEQQRARFGLEELRRRAALSGRRQTIKTSPLGIVGNTSGGKKLLGA